MANYKQPPHLDAGTNLTDSAYANTEKVVYMGAVWVRTAGTAPSADTTLYLTGPTGNYWAREQTAIGQSMVSGLATDLSGKVAKAGDALTGMLTLATSTATMVPLRIMEGVAPTTPLDGHLWRTGNHLFIRLGSTTYQLDAQKTPFVEITATTQTASVNTKYKANNTARVVITLPTDANSILGDQVLVRGYGTGGWRLAQPETGTVIHGASDSTSGTTGYVESQSRYDTVAVEKVASKEWLIIANRGTLTIG